MGKRLYTTRNGIRTCIACKRLYRFTHKCNGGPHQVRSDIRGYHWEQLARTKYYVMALRDYPGDRPEVIDCYVWRSWTLEKP